MLNIGAGEIALILVVALLVLGPKKLPELARGIGKFVREFRRQTDEVRSTLENEFYKMDQDLIREDIKPIAHGETNADGKILPPAVSGPLDGGRRPANELPPVPPPVHEVHGLEGAHQPPAGAPPLSVAEAAHPEIAASHPLEHVEPAPVTPAAPAPLEAPTVPVHGASNGAAPEPKDGSR